MSNFEAKFLQHLHSVMAAAQPLVLHRIAGVRQATLLKRYKRFFADVLLDGREVVAHCPNTGSMNGLLDGLGDTACLVTETNDPKRKLKFSLHAIESVPRSVKCRVPSTFVGIHSANANKLACAAIQAGLLDDVFGNSVLSGTEKFMDTLPSGVKQQAAPPSPRKRPRGPTPRSRVDLLLSRPSGAQVAVEVKSISMTDYYTGEEHSDGRNISETPVDMYRRTALFPDSVSLRAQRHVEELTQLQLATASHHNKKSTTAQSFTQRAAANCHSCGAAMLLVIQRGDVHGFAPCDRVDPAYGGLLRDAVAAGVGVAAMVVDIQADGTHTFAGTVPVYATHAEGASGQAAHATALANTRRLETSE